MDATQQLERDGFAIVDGVIEPRLTDQLRDAFERSTSRHRADKPAYALRDIFNTVPETLQILAHPPVCELMHRVLGPGVFAARGLYFDKVPGHNWPVGWHQDQVIAVERRIDTPGFGPWSVKAGATHVKAPVAVLQGMVALRLHLDDCPAENGALRCVPGSHRLGHLQAGRCLAIKQELGAQTCAVRRGGALLMKPLTLHASSPSRTPNHRRVIHIECAANDLPGRLNWFERRRFGS